MVKNLSNNRQNFAFRGVFDISNPEAVEKLIKLAQEDASNVIEPLMAVLSDDRFKDKHRKIIEIFGNLRQEKVIDCLISSLSHPDEVIRRYAAMSLGKLKSKKALMSLARLIKDPSIPLKKTLIESIHKITASQEVHFLSHFLTKPQEDYMDRFPENKNYYFTSVEDLIIYFLEEKELLRCYIHLAVLYEAEFRYIQAEEYILKALELRKDDIEIQLIYIKILKGLKKYSEILPLIKKILILKEYDTGYVIMYADILISLRKYEEAIELYDDIYTERQDEEIEEKLRAAHYYYGREFDEKGCQKEALEEYEKAHLLNPSHKEGTFFQAIILFRTNKIMESIKLLNKYIEENLQGKWYEEASELLNMLQDSKGQEQGLVSWVKGFWG